MINIKKVAHQLKHDGMYSTILIEVTEALKNTEPTLEEIEELIGDDEYYINEYKELNRYGEQSSVHAQKLIIDKNESQEVQKFKTTLNENVQELKNLENFEVDSKNSSYSIWIGGAGVMIIFMIHNIVALFSDLYNTHGPFVYASFAITMALTYWAYHKMKVNHEDQHKRYKITHKKTRAMIKEGLEKKYFSHEEFFEGVQNDG